MDIIKNKFIHTLVFSLGFVFLLIGFIGIFVPLLPTTPFVLLAAWCFLKTSPKTHQWIQNHPWIGPALKQWEETRSISKKAKWTAISMMSISLVIIWYKSIPLVIQASVSLCLVLVSTFILTRPNS